MENNTVLTNDPNMLNPQMPEGNEGPDSEETVEEEVVE